MKPFTVTCLVIAAIACAALCSRPRAIENLPLGRTDASVCEPALVVGFEESSNSYLCVGTEGPVTIAKNVPVHAALADQVRLREGLRMPPDAAAVDAVADPADPERLVLIVWKRPPEPPSFDPAIEINLGSETP